MQVCVHTGDDMMDETQKDIELKKELDKIDWSKYLHYGSVRVQVRDGKKTLTAIERTYPD